eukprot:5363099-Prymnesium_polylepis.1
MGHCERWAWPTLGELGRVRRVEDTNSGHEDDRFVGVPRMRGRHGVAPPDVTTRIGSPLLHCVGRPPARALLVDVPSSPSRRGCLSISPWFRDCENQ